MDGDNYGAPFFLGELLEINRAWGKGKHFIRGVDSDQVAHSLGNDLVRAPYSNTNGPEH